MGMIFDPYVQGVAGELPAEQEIAAVVTREILPGLRLALAKLNAVKQTSTANGVPALIEAAATNGTPLAGFAAEDWQAWEAAFTALQTFLATPQDSLGGGTVGGVLLKRYKVQE